jgi:hypothetical protein
MIGKPVSGLFARIGEPAGEGAVGGQTVYTWRTDRIHERGVGFIGSNSVYGSAVCTLRVFVDADDVIRSWDLDDATTTNRQSCDHFVTAMR